MLRFSNIFVKHFIGQKKINIQTFSHKRAFLICESCHKNVLDLFI